MRSIRWHLGHGRHLEVSGRGLIMGVLNVTPDSFSDGGRFLDPAAAVRQAEKMTQDGADIIDVGGESTRPGSKPVSEEIEQARVIPVIKALADGCNAVISVDTHRASTAKKAIEAGAHIVNDVWGLRRDPALANFIGRTRCGVVIMHSGRERVVTLPPIEDQLSYFKVSLDIARNAGIREETIMLDPGFGFAKETPEANLALIAGFERLHALGHPLLVGTSRKRFLGTLTGLEPADRDIATAATSAILRMKGASVFRVHNVAATRDALAVADAVLKMSKNGNGDQ